MLILPILIPLFAAISLFFLVRSRKMQRVTSILASLAHFGVAVSLLVQVSQAGAISLRLGSWPAPYGIAFTLDRMGAMMLAVGSFVALAVITFAMGSLDGRREKFGYYALSQILLMGVSGSFITADIFNLFVWFEVTLIASFVLMSLGGERAQVEGGYKYVALNLISSSIFLVAVGLLYASVGTLNFADLPGRIAALPDKSFVTVLGMLFIVTFGIKSALFPLFFWLPASYHTPPGVVSALFAGLLTKVGIFAMFRSFTMVFVTDPGLYQSVILVLAVLTMVFGALGAIAQKDLRRLLAFILVSHVGYMTLGLAVMSPHSLGSALYYMVHHMVCMCLLFLCAGIVKHLTRNKTMHELGGLAAVRPYLAILFVLGGFAISGLPPFSGFYPKVGLFQAIFASEAPHVAWAVLASSALTILAILKAWNEVFWGPRPKDLELVELSPKRAMAMYLPTTVLAIAVMGSGIFARPIAAWSHAAADQLLNPIEYKRATLGGVEE
ncbi:MAG: hypothetical protein KF784_13960 [Fimbriimonadaceae bacterium]|nr:hypothetical protein [Fimbriimonadaceae bacterium]